MAIHYVTHIEGEDFRLTLSTDVVGNYVAEAARVSQGEHPLGVLVRVFDTDKNRALGSLLEALHEFVTRVQHGELGSAGEPLEE